LLDAALARDIDRAGELLHRHIGFSAQRLLEGVRPFLPEGKPASGRSRRSVRNKGVA
jgi:hypothetical protein